MFDKLVNLEKQHDVTSKTQTPVFVADDEAPATSVHNPTIPSHAITFKKRPADDSFDRPTDKWQKYDLDDVNEHHLSNRGNQHALSDFLRTRAKPSVVKETKEEEEAPSAPVFRRPAKKQLLTDDDDEDNHPVAVHVPLPAPTAEAKTEDNDEDDPTQYRLSSIRKKARGVSSTNEKKLAKPTTDHPAKEDPAEDDDDDEDVDGELFEP